MPPIHVLIKPASSLCNLRCRYCFYCDVAQNRAVKSYGIMSEETLSRVVAEAFSFAEGECTFAFQGGEPTLAGLPFFERLMEFEKEYNAKGIRVHNAIQTNGIGLNDDWARFLSKNRFLVGLSMDGVKEAHDRYRVDAKGEETFKEVLKTRALFDKRGVEYNILTVVNSFVARRATAVYSFFKKNGMRFLQFIPCLDALNGQSGGERFSPTAEAYGQFLCTLFDQWHGDFLKNEAPSIRDFDNYIQMLMGYPPEACGMGGICGCQNVVEADGSVYPCDFYVLDELRLGNLNEVGFEEIYRKRDELGFIESSKSHNPACESCDYYGLCRGGCRRHRDDSDKTVFCASYKMFFDHAIERLMKIARMLRARM